MRCVLTVVEIVALIRHPKLPVVPGAGGVPDAIENGLKCAP